MQFLLPTTTEYLRSRKQFGVPLSTFQALTFRAADMYVSLELTHSMVDWATMVVAQASKEGQSPVAVADAARRVSVQVSSAGRHLGQEAIQLHGGIAMTMEYSVGMYTAHLTALDHLLGDGDPPPARAGRRGHDVRRAGPARLTVPKPPRLRWDRSRKVRAWRRGSRRTLRRVRSPSPRRCHRSPDTGSASPRWWSTPSLLAAYTELLGIPNDTISVFVWLWFGTIAWNIEAPWRYHLRFVRDWSIPMVGLVIYFYSRGLTDELSLPVHYTMPIHFDEASGSSAADGTCRPSGSSTSSAATRACARATRAGTTSSSPRSTPATS